MNTQSGRFRFSWLLLLLLLFTACAPAAAPEAAAPAPDTAAPAPGELAPFDEGEDVFVTAPELCSPDGPTLSEFQYVEKSDRRNYQADETTFEALYVNPKGQEFLFLASSLDGGYLEERLRKMRVCTEVLDTGQPAVKGGESQGLTEEELKQTQEFLQANPANMILEVVVATAKDVNIENMQEIHYFIDPTLDHDGRDDFRACRAYSSRVAVSVSSGSVSASLYRAGSFWDETTVATPGSPSDTARHNNGATTITYDALTQGVSGSSYTIYGGWRKDYSGTGIQSNVAGCG